MIQKIKQVISQPSTIKGVLLISSFTGAALTEEEVQAGFSVVIAGISAWEVFRKGRTFKQVKEDKDAGR